MKTFIRDFITNRSSGSAPEDESKSDAKFLRQFDGLPDLLAIARERDSHSRYRIQDELREEYRADKISFLYSTPVRSHGICRKCDEKFTEIYYEMENPPAGTSAKTSASHIHAVREHGATLDQRVKQFLSGLNL